ncbi:translocation/assembly module TamB domain-containing protein [Mangrovimonas xylaniphaga]|uniref:translocation/assembly module TamB domain-containing protein n=1 Tax=Mangrovimonas xylaniphaga TaxID=1645915 RepID=UPI000A94FD22|nr:translocation/assembly module TamB [Mangrovimonas xylaniphaga]
MVTFVRTIYQLKEGQTAHKPTPSPKKKYRALRILGKLLLGILLLFFLLVLFIRSPWGQDIIVGKAVNFISKKTHTKIDIEKLFVTFDGDIQLEKFYLETPKGDTLVYSKSLEVNMPLWALITGKGVGVDDLQWDGLRANIIRTDSIEGFNFQFLIDAFASEEDNETEKDTISQPLNLVLGKLNLNDFDIVYNDAVTGIDSHFVFRELQLDMDDTNLENMIFKASELTLSDANINFIQTDSAPSSESKSTTLPFLAADEITLKNVIANFESSKSHIKAEANIDEFYTELEAIDLAQNSYKIGDLSLKQSNIVVHTNTNNSPLPQPDLNTTTSNEFNWPDLNIDIGNIDFENNNFSYFSGDNTPKKDNFNPKAIALKYVNLKANEIFLKDKTAGLELENIQFQEASGINLNEFGLKLSANDQQLNIEQLNASVNNNELKGSLTIDYAELSQLISNPELSTIDLNLPQIQLDPNDIFKFQPTLKDNPYLQTVSHNTIKGHLNVNGTLASLNISDLGINWGKDTQLTAKGNIQNITKTDSIQFDIPSFSATTTREDLIKFVAEDSLGIQFPDSIQLTGTIKGNLKVIIAKAELNSSQGLANIDGHYNNESGLSFEIEANINQYRLDELLKNEELGPLSLSIKADGSGDNINQLNANFDAVISQFALKQYNIADLKLTGTIVDGSGTVSSVYKDDNLDLDLNALVTLDSIAPQASIDLNLKGANLNALGLMERNIRTGFLLKADFKGNSETFDLSSNLTEGVVVYDNKSYLIGDLNAIAHLSIDTTSVEIHNKLLDAELASNTNPQIFSKALKHHIQSYFFDDDRLVDTLERPVNLTFKGTINPSSLMNDVFLVNLKDLDTIKMAMDFNESAKVLNANISAPRINYSSFELDSLAFSIDTDVDNFEFDLNFKEFTTGPLAIPRTSFNGKQQNGEMLLKFLAQDNDETLINIDSKITSNDNILELQTIPSNLTINKEAWNIPESNFIRYSDKKLEFQDFQLSNNNELVELTHQQPDITKDVVAINFSNFNLNELLSYLNPNKSIASGYLNGILVLVTPFEEMGLIANLDITELNALDVDLGRLSLEATSQGNNAYNFTTSLKEGDVDLDLKGDYMASSTNPTIDLDLTINSFQMKALEGFSLGEISETKGELSGSFTINGPTASPNYQGQLNFKDAGFEITKFNASFSMDNETVSLQNDLISMENFTVKDANNNILVVTGDIGTNDLANPTFNLDIKADNFQVLNASREDNDLIYGTAVFDAEAKLTGDLQIPKLDINATLGKETDIKYIMPSASVNMEQRDGVVIFVNRDNPDAILTQKEEKTATVKGFDVKALIKVDKEAAVTIIINESTNDNFMVSGEGDFNFTMKPNGQMNLSGVYDVTDGHYEMSLYNLVNRKFELTPGSRVTWSGDPFDAQLDIRAMYQLKTSAGPLMASQTSNADPSVKSKYREVLPFEVFLNIDGELMKPVISFDIDMPEDEQGAIDGQVYGRIQQVNRQEEELNKQVFSLLVLNRFYPEPGSDGSSGGMATIARDNLNDAVSDQLNMFSDKLLGNTGFELNFGLDSFTDYQGSTPQDRTQLDIAAQKKLFNDRLTVQVGSEVDIQGSNPEDEEAPIIGNVTLEYMLTKNGRYRIKGFRRNEFENVIDGQTMVSGIALIFTLEFNKFSEFWHALVHPQPKEDENEKNENTKTETDN